MARQNAIMRLAVEGAEDLAADLGRHHEQAHGQQFDVFEAPDGFLQCNRFAELRVRCTSVA